MSAISIRDYEQRLAALATTQPTPQAFDQALGLAKGLLSALRDHVAGDAAAWGRVETERALLIGAVVAAHDAGGAP